MVNSLAEEIAESHNEDILEADQLLRQITVSNRKATYPETVYFQKLGWNEVTIRNELRRMSNVVRLQAVAGSPATREALEIEASNAAAVAEKELPKIDEQMAKLQAKRDAIERDKRLSAKRSEEAHEAARQLRALVPQHVLAQVNIERNVIEHSIGQAVRDAEIRVTELECCLTPAKYPDEKTWLETLRRSFCDVVEDHVSNRMISRRLSPAWPSIRESIQAELSELQAGLIGMKTKYSAAIEQAEQPLIFYSNGALEQ